MNVMDAVRQLGVSIQADERFKKYVELNTAAQKDEAVIKVTEKLRGYQEKFEQEAVKEVPDESVVEKLKSEYEKDYKEMFEIPAMKAMMDAREEIDKMMNEVSQIIYLTLAGQDPMTAQPSPEVMAQMQESMFNM